MDFVRFVLRFYSFRPLNLAAFVVARNHVAHARDSIAVLPWSSIFGSSRATQIITSDPNIAGIQGFTGGQISLFPTMPITAIFPTQAL